MGLQTSFSFLAGFGITAGLAWLCFNRLSAAKETGRFVYVFHGVTESKSPILFQICKVFITAQAYAFSLMAVIVAIALFISIFGNLE